MKKFYILDDMMPVRTEHFKGGGFSCAIPTLIGWVWNIEAYDMVNSGWCRNDEYTTCVEVTEEEFNACVQKRREFFASRGYPDRF